MSGLARATVALVALGLSLLAFFLWRGPLVTTPSSLPLAWTNAPPDAGELELMAVDGGLDFFRVQDRDEPMLWTAALRRDGRYLLLPELNAFHAEVHAGARVWLVGENQTEGPGPSLELLLSEDEGRTFELRASVPKPSYLAAFEALEVHGDEVRLVLSLDDALPVSSDWAWGFWGWLPPPLQPTLGPGRFVLRSKNAGRTWRLQR